MAARAALGFVVAASRRLRVRGAGQSQHRPCGTGFQAIHGLIRSMQQYGGIVAVVRINGLADGGTQMLFMTIDPVGQRDALADVVRDPADRRGIGDAWKYYDEFISAVAANDVPGAYSAGDTRGHDAQNSVAGGMAIFVIDGFEAIQVDEQQ